MREFFIFLLLLTCLDSLAQYQFVLKGTTPNGFNNHKVYLEIEDSYSSQKYKLADSAIVQNNQFFFRGATKKISEKATLSTKAKEIKGFIYFVVDSGLNTMVIKPLPPKWPLYKNKLSNTELLYSKSNAIKKTLDSLINYYYLKKGKPSARNKYLIELDSASRKQLRRKQIELLKQNPSIFYSIVHLYGEMKTAGGFKIDEAEEVYEVLDNRLKSSELGVEIKGIIAAARSTEIGQPVPVFTIKTDRGNYFSNSSLKETVYLLTFGATWCGPCKERLPTLKKIYEKYKADGFKIVYVNLDEKTDLWKQQIEKYSMSKWINVSESETWEKSEMVRRFNVSAIPFYLIVNRQGKIVYNPFQINDFDYKQLERAILSSLK